jgi:hypothetical protein
MGAAQPVVVTESRTLSPPLRQLITDTRSKVKVSAQAGVGVEIMPKKIPVLTPATSAKKEATAETQCLKLINDLLPAESAWKRRGPRTGTPLAFRPAKVAQFSSDGPG